MRKYLIAQLFLCCRLFAAQPFTAGTYTCVDGNEASICDQTVQVRVVNDEATLIAVEYVGWCGSQGPYRYSCNENSCSDGHITITPRSENTYYWENHDHGFQCLFKLK